MPPVAPEARAQKIVGCGLTRSEILIADEISNRSIRKRFSVAGAGIADETMVDVFSIYRRNTLDR